MDERRLPTLIVVCGRPGAGKTTLARALGAALPCMVVSRDDVKEGIAFTDRGVSESITDRGLADRTFELFFRTIELIVSGGAMLVAEAAFQDERWRLGLGRVLSRVRLKIIHCGVDPDLAHERVRQRRAGHANAHPLLVGRADAAAVVSPAHLRAFEPLSLPARTLHVDTTEAYAPTLAEIVAFALE